MIVLAVFAYYFKVEIPQQFIGSFDLTALSLHYPAQCRGIYARIFTYLIAGYRASFDVLSYFLKYHNFSLCLTLIEQPDRSAIRAKTRYDRLNSQPSQVFLNTIDLLGLEREVSEPANKNYNCTL